MKISIFYHLYQVNNWKNILDEQIQKICSSSLYGACDFVHIGINGNQALPYYLPKFKINYNNNQKNEADTLNSIWNFASNNKDYKILYFHNKGVSHFENPTWFYTTNSWRLYLEYFTINRWKDCVNLLEKYDTVGTEYITKANYWDSNGNWKEEIHPHYSGNFWWATGEYISKLDSNYMYSDEDHNIKLRSEFWIGSKNPNYYNFYNTNAECRYAHTYNPLEYMTI